MYQIATLYTLPLHKVIYHYILIKLRGKKTRAHISTPARHLASCVEEGLSLLRWDPVTQLSALHAGEGNSLILKLGKQHLGISYQPHPRLQLPGGVKNNNLK